MPGAYRRSLFMAANFPEVAAVAAVAAAPPGAGTLLAATRYALRYDEPRDRHDVGDSRARLNRVRGIPEGCLGELARVGRFMGHGADGSGEAIAGQARSSLVLSAQSANRC
jgi:hypothetical protein